MKKTIIYFMSLSASLSYAANSYTVVNSNGVYTYTTPTLANPANNLANPANNLSNPAYPSATTITGLSNPTANTSAANSTSANNTVVAGQLAGAVAASTAAHATGNPAAAMGAQNMMVNAGASAVSSGVMGAINAVMGH